MHDDDITLPANPAAAGTPASALPDPETIGPYRIVGVLGEGGMGRVYLAREDHPPREVALKVVRRLSALDAARFEREIELLAHLEHPGIARLYAAGEASVAGTLLPYLAMEYVRGRDLLAHTAAERLDLAARLRLVVAVCRAVHYAHGRGVIHRDLKPGNILVDPHGQPKVLDFGIARAHVAGGRELTLAGQVMGTLPYMSAEQLAGDAARVDARSDVYALGVIAYELVAGRLPHPKLGTSTLFEALDIVRNEAPPRLASLAPDARGDLDTVVMKALATEPDRRYASAAEFAADLERVLDHRPIEARPPTLGYLASRFVRRHRALTAAAGLSLAALIAATAVSLHYAFSEAAARREAEDRAAEAAAVNTYLERMLTSADPEQAMGREIRVREVLDVAAADLGAARLPDLTAARLYRTLGATYLSLGDGERADALYGQGEQRLGSDRSDPGLRADLVGGRAAALTALGRYDEAEKRLQGLLADGAPPLDAERRIGLMLTRAQILGEQGKVKDSIALLRQLVPEAEQALGADHLRTLSARHNLSTVLQIDGAYDEALAVEQDVYRRHAAVFGEDHPQTLFTRNQLGVLLGQLGRNDEAEATFRSTLDARRRVLGEKHPSTVVTRQNLGALLIRNGHLQDGVALVQDVVEALRAARGADDPKTLIAQNILAYGLEDLGELDRAETVLREIIAAQERQGGPQHPDSFPLRNNLGMLLMKRGKPAEALVQFDLLDAAVQKSLGADHPYAAIFASNRGECLARLGRLAEARQVLEDSHRRLTEKLGAGHERTRTAGERLAAVYDRLGLVTEARALRAKPASAP